MLTISRQTAQRFLYKFKVEPVYGNALQLLKSLEAIQLDPVSIVERNHHLTASLRLSNYESSQLESLLQNGQAVEYMAQAACLLPIDDYPLFADIRTSFALQLQQDLDRYKESTSTILSRLENEGPLASTAFTSVKKVRGGWDTDAMTTKETSHVLQLLFYTGDIQVVKRIGATRFFARTADVIPQSLRIQENDMSKQERTNLLIMKYARAYRLFSSDDPRYGWQKLGAARRKELHKNAIDTHAFTPVSIEGVKRPYAVLTSDVDYLLNCSEEPIESIEFLSPLDPLLWSRERIEDLYSFIYRWEIYTPASKRKIGPYGMPILWNGELIGQLSSYHDRSNKQLVVQQVYLNQKLPRTPDNQANLWKALQLFAERIGAAQVHWDTKINSLD